MSDHTVSTAVAQFTDAVAKTVGEYTDAPENVVDEIETMGDQLTESVADLEDDVRDVRETSEKNADRVGHNFEDICTIETRLDELEASNPQGSSEETATPEDDWTPIERLSHLGEDALDEHVSASDRRAVTIFEHWEDWSTKTPKGKLLKTADSLKSLLSTACDEHLAWKQVYRACRRIEQLSKGRITFFQHDKHGWMLKQHSAFASNHGTTAGVTASSAGA